MSVEGEPRTGELELRPAAQEEEWLLHERQSLADLVNRVLDRGVVVSGDVTISVAGVDLVYLGLGALLTSVSTARRKLHESGTLPYASRAIERAGSPAGSSAPQAARAPARPENAGQEDTVPAPIPSGDPLATPLVDLSSGLPERLEIDPEGVQRDLARLVLTLVELIRRIVEHQAVRRMDDPDLSEAQVERMGQALLALEEKLQEIKAVFGLADDQLNIDLGPLGDLL
jgi:hypothetical protein